MALALSACSAQFSRAPIPTDGVTIAAMKQESPRARLARAAGPALVAAAVATPDVDPQAAPPQEIDWRNHFDDISNGAILVQIEARRLSYWSPGAKTYREFPIAVPRDASLERRGRTRIVRMRENPDWRPTPAMLERNPKLPAYVGPGPDNPLGPRALYLGWQYYAIHGTNTPDSIGRATTSGCFRLFDEHIKWLYDNAEIGMPVLVLDAV